MRQLFLLLLSHSIFAQSFQYKMEDYPANLWQGDTVNFEYLAGTLDLIAPPIASTTITYMESQVINEATWSINIDLDFNPSSSNYVKIILASDSIPFNEGYYLRVGGSSDNLELFYKKGTNKEVILSSPDKILNKSRNRIELSVFKNINGVWSLTYRLDTLSEFTFIQGVSHTSMQQSSYYGIKCYYTATRSQKFHFDNILIKGKGFIDSNPPSIISVNFEYETSIKILFNEPVSNGSIVIPDSKVMLDIAGSQLLINLGTPVKNGFWSEISMSGWQDSVGNFMTDTTFQVRYFTQGQVTPGDIVINELMIDPTPPEDLPESEYIEIWNISDQPIQLKNWRISDLKTSSLLPDYILLPDSLLILTPESKAGLFGEINKIGIKPWPSLNNSVDTISLYSSDSMHIYTVGYNSLDFDSLYDDGRSIEMVNPSSKCGVEWKTALSEFSGTPGEINSRYNPIGDTTQFIVLDLVQENNGDIRIGFNKTLYKESLEKATFSIDGINLYPEILFPFAKILILKSEVKSGSRTLIIDNLIDCWENTLDKSKYTWMADFDAPRLDSVLFSHFDEVKLYFNEPVEPSSLLTNIYLPGIGHATYQEMISLSCLKVRFDTILISQNGLQIVVKDIQDLNGNYLDSAIAIVEGPLPSMASIYELIISEFMPTPDPEGTTKSEFIELFNPTDIEWSIRGYILTDAKTQTILNDYILPPKSFVILAPASKISSFNPQPNNIIGVEKWPVLNDSQDILTIKNPYGDILHRVVYDQNWIDQYSLSLKSKGYSFEMIDTSMPCSGVSNWAVSKNYEGTPGLVNSVLASKPDLTGPSILNAWLQGSDSISILFDEKLDTLSIQTTDFSLTPSISVSSVSILNDDGLVQLLLNEPLQKNQKYALKVDNIRDCNRNSMAARSLDIIRPDVPTPGDVIINEILFNPSKDGVDFLEIYNLSDKYLKLQDFSIGNFTDTIPIASNQILSPHQFMVFTKSKETLLGIYPATPMDNITITPVPQWPDDEGLVTLISSVMIDQFQYYENMHNDLLYDKEGVSLERLSPFEPGSNADNWKSASSIAGYATPGIMNSNFKLIENQVSTITIEPRVFNPDETTQPYTTIYYQFENPNLVGTISIYNSRGRLIRTLLNQGSLGTKGFMTWEGTDAKGERVITGYYLVLFETFDPNGGAAQFKGKVVVATRF